MALARPSATSELEQAFEVFNRVSQELDVSYRDLQAKVAGLTSELAEARSARVRELAEKERLAHRLSSLVSALPGGVLIVDAGQCIRDANPEAILILGEPLIGLGWPEVLSRQTLLGEQSDFPEIQLKSGRRVSVVSRQLDQSGDRVLLITDVSELHRLRGQVEQKTRLTVMGEMAARLAHQVRTPLSSATLYLSQLTRRNLEHSQRQAIGAKLGERLAHMSHLVDGMLTFVRGTRPCSERVYINELLDTFQSAISPQVNKCGASLLLPEVDDTLVVLGSKEELSGALCNLAMNAMEAAGGAVALELWVGALSENWLQLRFRDNGPGISSGMIDRIFDPFFTTRAQGTGLGLAVVAVTVAAHGGEIRVSNRDSGGAEFAITLPIANEISEASETMEVSSALPPAANATADNHVEMQNEVDAL